MGRATARGALAFWGLAACAFLVPALPRLVSRGLFMDGLWYAVIARNQALGDGSFWRPMLTPTLRPGFFADHPPLAFALEAGFFRLLGDHWWVAGVYSLATALVTMGLLVGLWRAVERDIGASPPSVAALGWLPVLFWVAIPLVAWSFSNNMLENTMGVFVLLAAAAAWRAATSPHGIAWSAAAGAALFGALLSKGVTGLFPLAFPLVLALTLRRPSPGRAAAHTLVMLGTIAGLLALALRSPGAEAYLERYLAGNFLPVVAGERGTVAHPFHIVGKLGLELLPALVVAALVAWAGGARGRALGGPRARAAAAFALLGLAGSLPLVLSPVQSGFYLVPSFAPFALALALVARPSAEAILAWLAARPAWRAGLGAASALLVAGTLAHAATQAGAVRGPGSLIQDVRAIVGVVPPRTTVGACPALYPAWSLHGYFALYGRVALDANSSAHEYFVATDAACAPPPGFARVDLPTVEYHLYRRVPGPGRP